MAKNTPYRCLMSLWINNWGSLPWETADFSRRHQWFPREMTGAFHSSKTFENLETAANGTEMFRKVFRNSGNCWITEMRTIQQKIPQIPGAKLNGKKTPGKKFSKIWENLARLSSFMEILENAFPFTTGSCRKFKADVLGWMESARRLRNEGSNCCAF